MNGLKTILTMLVAAYVVPLAVSKGLTVSPEQQAQIVGYALAGAAIVMRFLSNGPALGDIRAWLTAKAKPPAVVDIPTLADAVLKELLRRKAAKQQETKT